MKKNYSFTASDIAMGLLSIFCLAVTLVIGFASSAEEASTGVVLATTPVLLGRDETVKAKVDRLLRSLGINPSTVVTAPSYIRSLLEIDNSTSLYKFQLKSDQNVISKAIEMRLDRNDIFISDQVSYGIRPVVSGLFNRSVRYTYPNQTAFPAVVGPPAFRPDDLQVFWNSRLSLKVGNTVFIPNFDTRKFYYSPETQKSAATNYDQVDGQMDGRRDWTPQIILSGGANIEANVEVPLDAAIAVDNLNANTNNYLELEFSGFLLKEVNPSVMEAISKRLNGLGTREEA